MRLPTLVPSAVLHCGAAHHFVAVSINLHTIHACRTDVIAIGLLQLDIERVEALIETRAYPVEVHQLAVLVLVVLENRRQRQVIELIIRRSPWEEPFPVQAQTFPTLLGHGRVARHQEDVGQRPVLGNIETLEVLVLQIEEVPLLFQLTILVGIAQVVLQGVLLTAQLALGVQLEDIQMLVVPVVALILEAHRVAYLANLPDLELDGVFLQGNVGEEELAHRQREYIAGAVVGLHAEVTLHTAASVDTEAHQRVVAHAPELLLVGQRLHAGRGEHFSHLVHLYVIAVDIHRTTRNLGPDQTVVVFLHRFSVQVRHISDIVGEV